MTATQPDRLDRIEAIVEQNASAIDRLEQVSEKWDDRFNRLTNTVLTISLGLIASATIAVIVPQLLAIYGKS